MSKIKNANKYLILYSERLGIIAPRMITNKQEFRKWMNMVGLKKMKGKNILGTAYHTCGVIWINLREHDNNIQLRHTIAHELVHMKYRLPHGKRFDELTMQVVSNRYEDKNLHSIS